MLKTVLIAVVLLLVALTGAGFVASNRIHVERATDIDAEPAEVVAVLSDLRTWPEWSAWTKERDPSATWEFTGPERGVGATWSWKGADDGLGTGHLTITRSDPTGVAYDLVFDENGLEAPGEVQLSILNGRTRALWVYEGDLGPKPVGGLVKLVLAGTISKAIGEDFEKSLAGLKKRVEAGQATAEATEER